MKFLILFALCLMHKCVKSVQGELVFAHVVFRHGDRNIYAPFGSNDPFSDEKTYWKEGFAQLTDLGRQQQYKLGQYLARRYRELIGNKGYSDSKVYCRSTDVERAKSSARNTLAGMFRSSRKEEWNSTLEHKWKSMVDSSIPEKDDFVLATKKLCKKWFEGFNEVGNSTEMQKIVRHNAEFFKELGELAGRTVEKIGHVNVIYQTLVIEKLRGYKGFPTWAKKYMKKGSILQKIAFKDFEFYGKTPKMARIRPGFLLKEILERFNQKASGTLQPDRSLWLYSAHDVTIANILGGFDVYTKPQNKISPHIPPYSSCVFFELHKNRTSYYIEVYYKKEHGEDTKPLQPLMLRCGTKCSLNEFYEEYENIIPTMSYDKECNN